MANKNTTTASKMSLGNSLNGKSKNSLSVDSELDSKTSTMEAEEGEEEFEEEVEEEGEEESDDAPEMLETKLLSLDQLIENPENPRELFVGIDDLATSIEQNGLKVPLRVRETGKTKGGSPVYMVVSGHRRFRAMKSLGKAFADMPFKAEIQPADYDEKQAVYDDLAFNDGKELTLLEQGTVFARAREFGDTDAQIARHAGKSQTHIADCLMLHDKASDKLKKQISTGKIAATTVLDMLKEEGAEKTEEVVEKASASRNGKKITQKHLDKANGGAVGKSKKKANASAAKTSKIVDKSSAPKAEKPVETAESAIARMRKLEEALNEQELTQKPEAFQLLTNLIKWLDKKIEASDLAVFFFEEELEEAE